MIDSSELSSGLNSTQYPLNQTGTLCNNSRTVTPTFSQYLITDSNFYSIIIPAIIIIVGLAVISIMLCRSLRISQEDARRKADLIWLLGINPLINLEPADNDSIHSSYLELGATTIKKGEDIAWLNKFDTVKSRKTMGRSRQRQAQSNVLLEELFTVPETAIESSEANHIFEYIRNRRTEAASRRQSVTVQPYQDYNEDNGKSRVIIYKPSSKMAMNKLQETKLEDQY